MVREAFWHPARLHDQKSGSFRESGMSVWMRQKREALEEAPPVLGIPNFKKHPRKLPANDSRGGLATSNEATSQRPQTSFFGWENLKEMPLRIFWALRKTVLVFRDFKAPPSCVGLAEVRTFPWKKQTLQLLAVRVPL